MRSDHSNLNLITLSSAYKRKENAKVKTKNYICSKLVVQILFDPVEKRSSSFIINFEHVIMESFLV